MILILMIFNVLGVPQCKIIRGWIRDEGMFVRDIFDEASPFSFRFWLS